MVPPPGSPHIGRRSRSGRCRRPQAGPVVPIPQGIRTGVPHVRHPECGVGSGIQLLIWKLPLLSART